MKLVFEENELERIHNIYKEREEGRGGNLFSRDPEREYSITFKVTDPALAGIIFGEQLHFKIDKEIDLGIDVQSISYAKPLDKDEIRSKLLYAIDEILGE